MGKVSKAGCKSSHLHKSTPYPLASYPRKDLEDLHVKKNHSQKEDWEDARCSVCMEVPHNAVLLLCSSYNKGCRPYMCATSHRYSNCLEQYKKAYTRAGSIKSSQPTIDNSVVSLSVGDPVDNVEVPELLCPLCRRQVKGWTVVDPARKFMNAKKRTCMQDDCSFVGNYKELRKHVKAKHPLARPRAVDPSLEEKWKKLECEREHNDVISTIMSSTPGAVVLGDFVIEPGYGALYSDSDSDTGNGFFPLTVNLGRNGRLISHDISYNQAYDYESDSDFLDEDDFRVRRVAATGTIAPPWHRGFHRLGFGRSRRQRRHIRTNGSR
ncbi:Protein of unknown function (DUF1644) [Quillaja saponaria]|uniref:Uncharacterized protein n=1 Tax=Quillaja saponaria TaxID=32244 RepID=A0AAD7LJ39_QUISA|nr:Protein of unknown function (DUF1644) [Quillaja saponaria]